MHASLSCNNSLRRFIEKMVKLWRLELPVAKKNGFTLAYGTYFLVHVLKYYKKFNVVRCYEIHM